MITFEFAALNYISPQKNEYAYIMKGFDEEWNHIGNRHFATYTNLPPGKYTFTVKASNNDGVWNEEGVSLKITVTPPFWKTWWFYLICVLGLSFSGLFIHRLRIRQLKKRKEELELKVKKQTRQLEETNKELERMATHDALTGLSNYRHFSEFYDLEWRIAVRKSTPISVVMVDIDYFKKYNDTYGHQAGDRCLKKIAEVVHNIGKRPGDLAARYGGEEFIAVLPETESGGA